MLLTLRTTQTPATDLASFLGRDPGRVESFDLPSGRAHVFFPEAEETACTAALLLDVETPSEGPSDRPYAASSLLAAAVSRLIPERSLESAEELIPVEVKIAALPCRDGEAFLRRLFEPLGHPVKVEAHSLDPERPDLGPSPYFSVTLRATGRLRDLLEHLSVLIAALSEGSAAP
jgi:hypothetical protein